MERLSAKCGWGFIEMGMGTPQDGGGSFIITLFAKSVLSFDYSNRYFLIA